MSLRIRFKADFRRALAILAMACLATLYVAVACGAQTHALENAGATLDEVLVTGERPGPGMWRVSKGAHDLWILATLDPVPKKMTWRSADVEARIQRSQLVLAPPRVKTNIGFFRGLALLPAALRARGSPDGRPLRDVLPHDLYIRWLALRVRYLGQWGDDEKMRPMLAAFDVFTRAIDQSGLTFDDGIWDIVERVAHRNHVPIRQVTVDLSIEDPKGAIRELKDISPAAEVQCLETTITRLETDLQPMRQRANLWSLGDVAGLRASRYPDEKIACLDALFSVPALRTQMQRARAQVIDAWLEAADHALDTYPSTFAILPIGELLAPDGWLARMRDRGYTVVEPH